MDNRIIELFVYLVASGSALYIAKNISRTFAKLKASFFIKTTQIILVTLVYASIPAQLFIIDPVKVRATGMGADEMSFHLWLFALATPLLVVNILKEIATWRAKNGTNRQLIARLSAPFFALLVLFTILIGPLFLVFLFLDIPPGGHGPDWGVWVLVLSGGVGAGAARYTYNMILGRIGSFTETEVEAKWHGYE